MKLFVGLDMSQEKTAIRVPREHGQIVMGSEAARDPARLTRCLGDPACDRATIGLGGGPVSQWGARGLIEAGLEAVLMETRRVKRAE